MGKTRALFRKIRDTKGTFHAKMGSIKDRNGMDLTEAEDIKKRWQEYTEELDKKDLHTDSQNVDVHSCHLLFDHFQFALIHGPNIPSSYAILLFTTSDLASITSHIHNWVFFLLPFCPFILSGVTSLLISSNILVTYRPGEFLFQYPIILHFHTVHAALKARILKWFAIPFFSGTHSVRTLHHGPSILGGPYTGWLIILLCQTRSERAHV